MPRRDVPGAGSVDPVDHPPVPFPDVDWAWFAQRSRELGLDLDDDWRPLCEALHGHLLGVNRWLNLTRIASPRAYLKQHLLDALLGLHDRRLRHLSEGTACVDLGSGGGYPGLPLALALPRIPWVLVDSRARKVAFLRAAIGLLGRDRLEARHFRAREVASAAGDLRRRCQVVVARAVGQTDRLLAESAELLAPHGHLLAWKGPAYEGEEQTRTEAALPRLGYRHVTTHRFRLEADDPERLIVVFERIH